MRQHSASSDTVYLICLFDIFFHSCLLVYVPGSQQWKGSLFTLVKCFVASFLILGKEWMFLFSLLICCHLCFSWPKCFQFKAKGIILGIYFYLKNLSAHFVPRLIIDPGCDQRVR